LVGGAGLDVLGGQRLDGVLLVGGVDGFGDDIVG
jgi:hypothetical protein